MSRTTTLAPVRRARGPVLAAMAGFTLMFGVALVHLSQLRWFPVLDLALTEMRIRDISNGHSPLVGLIGRIGPIKTPGSHPGPISFYLLWPAYRLFGSTAFAMEVSTVALDLGALATALVFAARRGGVWMVGLVAAALAGLMYVLGPQLLVQPWNPYLPTLWFFAFAMAVWSVLDRDVIGLPVAVIAGTFCVETHISYAVIVAAAGTLMIGTLVYQRWRDRGSEAWNRTRAWLLGSVALGLALWVPPMADELLHRPGNLTTIWNHFSSPPEAILGLGRALELFLRHLDLSSFVAQRDGMTGSVVPGAVLVCAWLAFALIAARERETRRRDPESAGRDPERERGTLDQPHLRPALLLPDAVGLDHRGAHGGRARRFGRGRWPGRWSGTGEEPLAESRRLHSPVFSSPRAGGSAPRPPTPRIPPVGSRHCSPSWSRRP